MIQKTQIKTQIDKTKEEKGQGATFNGDLSVWDTDKGGYIATITMDNVENVSLKDIQQFKNKYDKVIRENPNNVKIGIFNLANDDGIDIDLNVRVTDKQKAIEIGQKFNQESVFDAYNFECIPTGGRGESKDLSIDEILTVLNEYIN